MRYYVNFPVPDPFLTKIKTFKTKWQGISSSDPHVTIVTPKEIPNNATEEALIGNIRTALATMRQFPVTFVKLGYFDNKSTIYVSVSRTEEFVECNKSLTREFERFTKPDHDKFSGIPTPHVTLATHLLPTNRERAWEDANRSEWKETFPCTTLQLLRKAPGEAHWTIIAAFHLI